MLALLFVIFVVVGFLFHLLNTFPVAPYCARIASGAEDIRLVLSALGVKGL